MIQVNGTTITVSTKTLDATFASGALVSLRRKDGREYLTEAAKDKIIAESYDPVFGARPMKRYLQSKVETLIARTILSGSLNEGDTVTVDVRNGELACI